MTPEEMMRAQAMSGMLRVGNADLMSPQAQAAYRDATGSSINGPAAQAPEPIRTSQGVTPPPANLQGLAAMLVKRGDAPNLAAALQMIQARR